MRLNSFKSFLALQEKSKSEAELEDELELSGEDLEKIERLRTSEGTEAAESEEVQEDQSNLAKRTIIRAAEEIENQENKSKLTEFAEIIGAETAEDDTLEDSDWCAITVSNIRDALEMLSNDDIEKLLSELQNQDLTNK
jgi:hypothetical protein